MRSLLHRRRSWLDTRRPLALAPMWLIGTLDRGAWTPDEPREADIAWRMSVQTHWVLPHLANQPFLEKPPLSYWMSAGSMRLFGPPPAAARVPNLFYARSPPSRWAPSDSQWMGGRGNRRRAGGEHGDHGFRVSMWLAPDACLLAGCAVSLLGAYIGYTASPGRRKLRGYLLMHAGAAAGFMAKSAPGWLVPALALLTLIAWERRWSELRRPELYAGFLCRRCHRSLDSCRRAYRDGADRCAFSSGTTWPDASRTSRPRGLPLHRRASQLAGQILHRAACLPSAVDRARGHGRLACAQMAWACTIHAVRLGDSPSRPHSPS